MPKHRNSLLFRVSRVSRVSRGALAALSLLAAPAALIPTNVSDASKFFTLSHYGNKLTDTKRV